MEAVALQERLQLIQQQQMERFKSRKSLSVKREDSENLCPDHLGAFTSSRAHHGGGVGPEFVASLDLRTATQEDTTKVKRSTSDVGDEDSHHSWKVESVGTKEVEFLKHQVEQLQLDNTRLRSDLKQKNRKVLELEKVREEERMALGTAGMSATQRIVELSKRNRELSAEVATEKNCVRQLQKKLKDSENSTTQKESCTSSVCNKRSSRHRDVHKHELVVSKPQEDGATCSVTAQLQDQLKQSKLKMAKQRNQCQVLKQELKLAQRVITKEVGEGVSMSALLSGVSGWRGRAQQIIALQNKVAELGEQLQQARQSTSTQVERMISSDHCDILTGPMVDSRQKATLHKIESDKQKNLDEARSELESLRADYSKTQQQCSALRARNKTLSSDVKSLKVQVTSLTEKQSQNDKLIAALRDKSSTCYMDEELHDVEHRGKDLLHQDDQLLQAQLAKCLIELQAAKGTSRMAANNQCTPPNAAMRTSSLPPVVPQGSRNSRGPTERKAISAGQPLGCLQLESDKSGSAAVMTQVSQIERERLIELTSCLQKKLDATTDKLMRLEIETRILQQRNARLEKIVGKTHTTGGLRSKETTATTRTHGHDKVEKLESQLAVQLDENALLKETLELTRQEKLEDMKRYQTILKQVKLSN